jgi:hypothetical protein
MKERTQEELESIYLGNSIKYTTHNITSELVNVLQIIEDTDSENVKLEEDKINKLKIKMDISYNEETEELFIAKTIATNFQKMRKLAGFHIYDSLKLVMKDSYYNSIIIKHMDYISKITRLPIEIITNDLLEYSYKKDFEINDKSMDLYLVKLD